MEHADKPTPGQLPPLEELIACHECDLLQTEPVLAPGETARCARCGAFLARNPPDSVDRSLALCLAAAILYLIGNIYPLVGLEMQGQRVEVTLAGALLKAAGKAMAANRAKGTKITRNGASAATPRRAPCR